MMLIPPWSVYSIEIPKYFQSTLSPLIRLVKKRTELHVLKETKRTGLAGFDVLLLGDIVFGYHA